MVSELSEFTQQRSGITGWNRAAEEAHDWSNGMWILNPLALTEISGMGLGRGRRRRSCVGRWAGDKSKWSKWLLMRNAANSQNYSLTKLRPDTKDARRENWTYAWSEKEYTQSDTPWNSAYHEFIRKKRSVSKYGIVRQGWHSIVRKRWISCLTEEKGGILVNICQLRG